MPSIAVLKTWLSVLLLSLIASSAAEAEERTQVYRFGGWTLIAPAEVNAAALERSALALQMPAEGLEFIAYWQDGRQRALALRFDASDGKQDAAVVSSQGKARQLKGCKLGGGARIKALKKMLPTTTLKAEDIPLFPDDAAISIPGGERGLRRAGDVLVADIGSGRVQIAEDSPVVRFGAWGSAEFCRVELNLSEQDQDDD